MRPPVSGCAQLRRRPGSLLKDVAGLAVLGRPWSPVLRLSGGGLSAKAAGRVSSLYLVELIEPADLPDIGGHGVAGFVV